MNVFVCLVHVKTTERCCSYRRIIPAGMMVLVVVVFIEFGT